MFDVSAYCISLYLEMQSKNKMNPLTMSPREVLQIFFCLLHLSNSYSHSKTQSAEYIKCKGCCKCILSILEAQLTTTKGLVIQLKQNPFSGNILIIHLIYRESLLTHGSSEHTYCTCHTACTY